MLLQALCHPANQERQLHSTIEQTDTTEARGLTTNIIYIILHTYVQLYMEGTVPSMQNQELFGLKAELCKTFSDPKRLIIINELGSGEKLVGDLAQILQIPHAVVSRHLALLRNRGVVTPRREGKNVYYRLSDPKIAEACDLIHQVLLNQLGKNRDLAERLID